MARPKKDVSKYFGQKIQGTRLKVIKEAGRDSQGRILVKVLCDCKKQKNKKQKKKIVILSQVLSGHIKSCGCLKHELHVKYIQHAVDQLTSTEKLQCFLATADKYAPKPDLQARVITSAHCRHTESLKTLPDHVALDVRLRVLAHENYAAIARDNGLQPAEIGWIYKHVIKPEIKARPDAIETQSHLKGSALFDISCAKEKLQEQKRNRFWASELRTPGSKPGPKEALGFAWVWMMDCAPFMELNSEERNLLNWFRLTAARTFRARREKRREMAQRELEKRWNDVEAAA
jgi:hypothetical protein